MAGSFNPLPTGKRKSTSKPRQKAANQPPISPNGIEVAIGPHDKSSVIPDNVFLTVWTTFHITPEQIGPTGTAQWGQNQIVGGPALPVWTGFQPRQIPFQGQLEPPLIYLTSIAGHLVYANGRPISRSIESTFPTDVQPIAQLTAPNLTKFGRGNNGSDRTPTVPSDLGTDASVVMQRGANSGGHYIEPHAFASMMDEVRSSGEVLRLIVGDQYGLNLLVHVSSWQWTFQDTDPDVINYSVTFEEHFIAPTPVATSHQGKAGKKSKKTPSRVDIVDGDTLWGLAARYLGSGKNWVTLLALNLPYIEKMFKHSLNAAKAGQRQVVAPYTIGVNRLSPSDPKVGKVTVSTFNPHQAFRAGGSLMIKPPSPPRTTKRKS